MFRKTSFFVAFLILIAQQNSVLAQKRDFVMELNKKANAISKMIRLIKSNQKPVFMIMLSRYYIDGVTYRAFGFTVSDEHTPDIKQTAEGIETTTYFRANMIHPKTRKGKVIKNGLIKVKLKIRIEDIHAIVGRAKGSNEQITLYQGNSQNKYKFYAR